MRSFLLLLILIGVVLFYISFPKPTPPTLPKAYPEASSGLSGFAQPQPTPMPLPPTPLPATPLPPAFLDMDAVALNNAGLETLAKGDLTMAMTYFQYAIERKHDFYEPYNNLAGVLYEQGRIEEAILCWEEALKLESDSPDANAGLGTALAAKGEFWLGWSYYQRALQLDADYADATKLVQKRLWGPRALTDSEPLRQYASQVLNVRSEATAQ
nr:tetratricopeptide repeat protein [Oscillochloris trichoides]